LPLVAVQHADAYDGWACRWLARCLTETGGATASGDEAVAPTDACGAVAKDKDEH